MSDTLPYDPHNPPRYEDMPITATPREVWNERRYVGELNIYTDSPHPLTIELPCPPKGLYSYKVEFVRKGTGDDR